MNNEKKLKETKIRNTYFKDNNRLSNRKIIAIIAVMFCILFILSFGISIIKGANFSADIATESIYSDKVEYWPMLIVSESMEPAIMTYSVSICKTATIDDIEVGDIVLFWWKNEQVAHRCIEKGFDEWEGKTYVTTKGDNNKAEDGVLIYNEMITGEVFKIYNEVAPILSKFILPDKTLNTIALVKVLLFTIVSVILIFAFINWIFTFFIGFCKTFLGNKYYNREVARYLRDLDRFESHKDRIIDFADNDLQNEKISLKLRIARAQVMREIKVNSESIKDFDKRLNKIEKRIKHTNKKK